MMAGHDVSKDLVDSTLNIGDTAVVLKLEAVNSESEKSRTE